MFASLFLTVLVLSAGEGVEGLEPTITLNNKSIHPRAPLSMSLTLRLVGDEGDSIRAVFVNNDDVKICVRDSSGTVVKESIGRTWRCEREPRHVWLARFKPEKAKEARRYLAFQEWCSTDFSPGKYEIELAISELGIIKVGEVASERRFLNPPLKLTVPIEVLKEDDNAVREEYEQLLKDATAPVTSATVEQQEQVARAVELIAYSQEPLALPSQFKLLSGAVEMWGTTFVSCNAIDLLVHFIDLNSPEVAEGLLQAYDDLQAEKYPLESSTRHFLSDLVLWAIHEMHQRGNPEVVKITEPIVQALPKPADPRNQI